METFNIYLPEVFEKYRDVKEDLEKFFYGLNIKKTDDSPDIVIVIGGDGALLHAIRYYGFKGTYILLNAGTLGHYAEMEIDEIDKFKREFVKGKYSYEEFNLLEVSDGVKKFKAINDVMIGSAIKTLVIKIGIDGEELLQTKASGILFSTAFGSSGYAHSLGGTLLVEDVGISMNLLAPLQSRVSASSLTSLLVKPSSWIEVEVVSGKFDVATDMNLIETKANRFIIKKSDDHFRLMHFEGNDNPYLRLKRTFVGI